MVTHLLLPTSVQEGLSAVEARLCQATGGQSDFLSAAIRQLLSAGGKRTRPTLSLLTAGLLSADPERSVALAAAVEMLHMATLVHDDLIDRALLRRGAATLNASWTPDAVVLTGDFMFARSAELVAETDNADIMRLFARTLTIIVEGEIRQKLSLGDIDRGHYYERIYAKTGALFVLAVESAALLGNAAPAGREALRAFAHSIGMAFQVVDDVLDFIGDPARMGKPVGSDLRHGLVTLPAICYIQGHPQDADVQALLRGQAGQDGVISRMVTAVRESGAIDEALAEAQGLVAQGQRALAEFSPGPYVEALSAIAEGVVRRQA